MITSFGIRMQAVQFKKKKKKGNFLSAASVSVPQLSHELQRKLGENLEIPVVNTFSVTVAHTID